MKGSGRCLCGDVTYSFDGKINWAGHCHCESCRRNTSSPVTTFFAVNHESYEFTGKTPAIYESSPGVRRHFCGTCGSPVGFDADKYGHEMHFYIAALDDPASIEPQFHVFHAEKLPWFEIADDLPRHDQTSNG